MSNYKAALIHVDELARLREAVRERDEAQVVVALLRDIVDCATCYGAGVYFVPGGRGAEDECPTCKPSRDAWWHSPHRTSPTPRMVDADECSCDINPNHGLCPVCDPRPMPPANKDTTQRGGQHDR